MDAVDPVLDWHVELHVALVRLRFGVEGLRLVGLAPQRSRATSFKLEKSGSRPSPWPSQD